MMIMMMHYRYQSCSNRWDPRPPWSTTVHVCFVVFRRIVDEIVDD